MQKAVKCKPNLLIKKKIKIYWAVVLLCLTYKLSNVHFVTHFKVRWLTDTYGHLVFTKSFFVPVKCS